jgi:ketosteroid isomerase-like protein
MYAWVIGRIVRWGFGNLTRGTWQRPFRLFADDIHFVFAGDHALACELHRKADVRAWFERVWPMFDMNFEVHDVLVRGWLRETRISTRFTNRMKARDGTEFKNEGMQYARLRWGRVVEDLLYEDTQMLARAVAHADSLQGQS